MYEHWLTRISVRSTRLGDLTTWQEVEVTSWQHCTPTQEAHHHTSHEHYATQDTVCMLFHCNSYEAPCNGVESSHSSQTGDLILQAVQEDGQTGGELGREFWAKMAQNLSPRTQTLQYLVTTNEACITSHYIMCTCSTWWWMYVRNTYVCTVLPQLVSHEGQTWSQCHGLAYNGSPCG